MPEPSVVCGSLLTRLGSYRGTDSGGKQVDKLMAFMAEHATRSPAASSPPPPPPFAQRFREVRALRGARALRALAAAPLLAYVRYDPVECGAACAELDGPWETAATFDVPGGVWHVACAEERQLCAFAVDFGTGI